MRDIDIEKWAMRCANNASVGELINNDIRELLSKRYMGQGGLVICTKEKLDFIRLALIEIYQEVYPEAKTED